MLKATNGFDLPPEAGRVYLAVSVCCGKCGLTYTRPYTGRVEAYATLMECVLREKGWDRGLAGLWLCPDCAKVEERVEYTFDLTGRR